jgi:hypothetical protein
LSSWDLTILIPSNNNTIPPAIRKEFGVMPKISNKNEPKNVTIVAITKAVMTDFTAIIANLVNY